MTMILEPSRDVQDHDHWTSSDLILSQVMGQLRQLIDGEMEENW